VRKSYNKINGIFASESPIIEDILRRTWGYDGCIISDWFGTRSGIPAIKAGLDLEMPVSVFRGESLVKEVQNGSVSEELVEIRARSVLRLMDRTKESHSSAEEKSTLDDQTNQIAREIAAEGIVLVKNEKNVLPLDFSAPLKVAVIGDPAQHPSITGGGSAASVSQYIQRPIDCLRAAHIESEEVRFAPGVRTNVIVPVVSNERTFARDGRNGVDVTYYNDDSDTPIAEEYQPSATVLMLGHLKPGLNASGFRFEMTTKLLPRSSGLHTLAVRVSGAFHLFVDGDEVSFFKVWIN
jgi:beta-glucosidase